MIKKTEKKTQKIQTRQEILDSLKDQYEIKVQELNEFFDELEKEENKTLTEQSNVQRYQGVNVCLDNDLIYDSQGNLIPLTVNVKINTTVSYKNNGKKFSYGKALQVIDSILDDQETLVEENEQETLDDKWSGEEEALQEATEAMETEEVQVKTRSKKTK